MMEVLKRKRKIEITQIEIDYEAEIFIVYLSGFEKPVDIFFFEIESFIGEFDKKLEDYLSRFDNIKDKIFDAVDIGYDFKPMLTDLIHSFIENGLIKLYD